MRRWRRRSIRLKDYDYSRPGGYFVTICTIHKQNLFSNIIDGIVVLNEFGQIIQKCWYEIPKHFDNVGLDEMVIMPNHFHGIIFLTNPYYGINRQY